MYRKKKDENPLEFWRAAHDTPLLRNAARAFLCGQASTVSSGRVFSVAGDIVTVTRSLLDAESVDALILIYFMKKNMDLTQI